MASFSYKQFLSRSRVLTNDLISQDYSQSRLKSSFCMFLVDTTFFYVGQRGMITPPSHIISFLSFKRPVLLCFELVFSRCRDFEVVCHVIVFFLIYINDRKISNNGGRDGQHFNKNIFLKFLNMNC